MPVTLTSLTINNFKRIKDIDINLSNITALVGGNTSGKTSILQAAQLGISILQAAYQKPKKPTRQTSLENFDKTLSSDTVLFRPHIDLLKLRHSSPATQDSWYSVEYKAKLFVDDNEKKLRLEVRRGKNANIAVRLQGDSELAEKLANRSRPFSIFTPGISGIPLREEWRTRAAMDAGVMHGEANLFLRTVLAHLYDSKSQAALNNESRWENFHVLLNECYQGARVTINHDPERDRFIEAGINYQNESFDLASASTGMLQVIQILAYASLYNPPLLLLDEPDCHLHADSQSRLFRALRLVSENGGTRVILATHSPYLVQKLIGDSVSDVKWLDGGSHASIDSNKRPAIPLLMSLGALSSGKDVLDADRRLIVLTEDEKDSFVRELVFASGGAANAAFVSYRGCQNLEGARLLAEQLAELRPDALILIHRDRDFRTNEEMEFELIRSRVKLADYKNVFEVFTGLNDVEHHFVHWDHVSLIFPDITRKIYNELMESAIEGSKIRLISRGNSAREKIRNEVYDGNLRNRKKEIWVLANMPERWPDLQNAFQVRDNGGIPFEALHGKTIYQEFTACLGSYIGRNTEDVRRKILTRSNGLGIASWNDILNVEPVV
jgi:predicted ATPase